MSRLTFGELVRQLGRLRRTGRCASSDERQPPPQQGQPTRARLLGQRVDLDAGLAGGDAAASWTSCTVSLIGTLTGISTPRLCSSVGSSTSAMRR